MTVEGSIYDALLVRPDQSAIELVKTLSANGIQLTKVAINKILYAGAARGYYTQRGMPPRWSCTAEAPSAEALDAVEVLSAQSAEVKSAEAKLEQRIIEFEAMVTAQVAELARKVAELNARLDAQLDAQLNARLETPGAGPGKDEASRSAETADKK
jgi:hypothetical protein